MATLMFRTIAANRRHLRPWFTWEKITKRPEDSLKYLLDKEDKVLAGAKVEYGIYIKNQYIGNIGIFDIDPVKKSAEIGYWLDSRFTRHGYMSEAVKILEKEFFLNQGLNRIQIKADEKNIPSAGVAKKCGYSLEGRLRSSAYSEHFRNFRNMLIFSKLKSEFKK